MSAYMDIKALSALGCSDLSLGCTSGGAYYNYFRDYDPSTGRYIQSDPIGLYGGMNTYLYVGGNPLNYLDLLGLAPKGMGGKGAAVMENLSDLLDTNLCDWWPSSPKCRGLTCVRWKCETTDDCGNTTTHYIGRGHPYAAPLSYDPGDDESCKCDTYCAAGHPDCPGVRVP